MLRPDRQPSTWPRPFSHQREAWEHLDAELRTARPPAPLKGLLVMPTGSGKTYTAVHWLTRRILDQRGGRILWLAHRNELLEQAADTFHRMAGLAQQRDRLRMRLIAGDHHAVDQIEPDDDVVIASVMMLTRCPERLDALVRTRDTVLVVDEAHHGPAESYQAVLSRLAPGHHRLGLTATPTRTRPRERPVLAQAFGNRILYEEDLDLMIERGILARPVPVRVTIHEHGSDALTAHEWADRDDTGDYSPALLRRMASLERRNRAIVDHYLQHRTKYGKTLIFALDVDHAVLLVERLRMVNVRADYVARRRDDRDNRSVLERFRRREDGLDVLVSVLLLTEGVDLPTAQTVLLARPTRSEILLRQMLGRGLRGPAVGGTELLYLVGFVEDWPQGLDLRDPFALVPDLVPPPPRPVAGAGRASSRPISPPWPQLRSTVQAMGILTPPITTEGFEAVSARWYVLGRAAGPDGLLHVYGHQVPFFEAVIEQLLSLPATGLAAADPDELVARGLAACGTLAPHRRDLERLVDHMRAGGLRPHWYGIEERRACEPRVLAQQIWDGNLGVRTQSELIHARYGPLARAIYPTLRAYHAAIEDALFLLLHPQVGGPAAWLDPVFETVPHLRRRPRTSPHSPNPTIPPWGVK